MAIGTCRRGFTCTWCCVGADVLSWPLAAQGVEKLLKPPAEPARLSFAAELTWQQRMLEAILESVATAADFLGIPRRRPKDLRVDQYKISTYPSHWAARGARSSRR